MRTDSSGGVLVHVGRRCWLREENLNWKQRKDRAFYYERHPDHDDVATSWWTSHWTKPAAGSSSAGAAPPAAVPLLAPRPGVVEVDLEEDNDAPALCS